MNPNRRHKWDRKKRKGIRKKGILWEYDGDGRYAEERYSTFDKRYWRRWKRRLNQQEAKDQHADSERNGTDCGLGEFVPKN